MTEYKVGDRFKVNAKYSEHHGWPARVAGEPYHNAYGVLFVPCFANGKPHSYVASVLVDLDAEIGPRLDPDTELPI